MASYYRTNEMLRVGDPVCLVPGQPGKVTKATAETLLTARAVLGVALGEAAPPEVVLVGDSGAIPAESWDRDGRVQSEGLGTLIVAREGQCRRVVTSDRSDYTIGVLQADGALVIQRDYELSLATHRIINVKDFGAIGDGVSDDSPAFAAALEALPPGNGCTGTIIFVPPGVYSLTRDLDIYREAHILGGGGAAGNAGVRLVFVEGYGIVVHSHLTTPVEGQFAGGCLIEGLAIFGTPPRGVHGGVPRDGLPERWRPDTAYTRGDRVCAYRSEPDGPLQGYRYFYWECVREGRSGTQPPNVREYNHRFAAHHAHVPDLSTEWRPSTQYRVGQVVRPPNRFNVIFVKSEDSTSHVSGPPPDWDAGTEVRDNGIIWLQRDASPYLLEEEPDRLAWSCRVHAGIRAHISCEVKRCWIEGFLNAGVWIGADDAWYPLGNAIGWRIESVTIANCGTGVCVQGTRAHQGLATSVVVSYAGCIGAQVLDWSSTDQGGNGGISFCDLSYFGNQWSTCTNEFASDRGLVCEGLGNGSIITAFWDEGTLLREGTFGGAFLNGGNTGPTVIGGRFNPPFDPGSVNAAVGSSGFRKVEETNFAAPRHTRAMLHIQGQDDVFLWTANRANPIEGDYSNTIGWRHSSRVPANGVDPHGWVFSYQNNTPYPFYSVQDGFSALGIGWRDPIGHFNGLPGTEYFYGVSWNAENSNTIRRGLREVGDRFEPRLPEASARGRFLGKVVVGKGFRALDRWSSGVGYLAFSDAYGWAPHMVEVDGFVFVCTRSGVSSDPASPPDFATAIRNRTDPARSAPLSPIFGAAKILSTWLPGFAQQLGMLKRPTRRAPDGHYYHYVCEQIQGRGQTSGELGPPPRGEPSWTTGLDDLIADNEVTWKCLGPDPDDGCILEEPSGLQWTCVGPVASFAQYSPVYEKGNILTNSNDWTVLDEYSVLPRTCAQFDVVVTSLGQSGATSGAAAFSLRGACFHDGSTATLLGDISIDRRRTRDDIDAALRLEMARGFWVMRLYVRGAEGLSLRWKSVRRPHTDADWERD